MTTLVTFRTLAQVFILNALSANKNVSEIKIEEINQFKDMIFPVVPCMWNLLEKDRISIELNSYSKKVLT
ncbi:hypothetical protein MUG91_G10n51 [Manis pentadactyla]|nr:hypothetical protein MUG91_G10n51 [Manis pentadactyla]